MSLLLLLVGGWLGDEDEEGEGRARRGGSLRGGEEDKWGEGGGRCEGKEKEEREIDSRKIQTRKRKTKNGNPHGRKLHAEEGR